MTDRVLSMDFETRSPVDLSTAGAHVYAAHPDTLVLCLAYAFDDEPVCLWRWFEDGAEGFPAAVLDHVAAGGTVRGWNVTFERLIWNGVLLRQLGGAEGRMAAEQTRCTMTEALAMALPGALGKCAAALNLDQQKDDAGHRIMLQLSQPRRARKGEDADAIHWWTPEEAPDKYARLYAYCSQDVDTERAVARFVRPLTSVEQALYVLDAGINDVGVAVDIAAATAAIPVAQDVLDRAVKQFAVVVKGAVSTPKAHAAFGDWARSRGVDSASFDAETTERLLASDDIPDDVREALEIRQEVNRSSVAKIKAMLARAAIDGRARGNYQFNGAGSTGRWAARGIQLQNLPRKGCSNPDAALAALTNGAAADDLRQWGDNPLKVLAGSLRGLVVAAEGHRLVDLDFSNIEGRTLAWLADETWKITAFDEFDRGIGHDLYVLAYARSFGRKPDDVTKDERAVGKVQELALGYAGGVGAFQSMAKIYRVEIEDARAEQIKEAWREAHPATTAWWHQVETAAKEAVRHPRKTLHAGKIAFHYHSPHLWMKLPSGRLLCYPFAKLAMREGRFGNQMTLVYWRQDPITKRWSEARAWRGLIVENAVQAIARDIQARAMTKIAAAGLRIVLHTHDEICCEVPTAKAYQAYDTMQRIMAAPPEWATGLPIAAEGWIGRRYRKD